MTNVRPLYSHMSHIPPSQPRPNITVGARPDPTPSRRRLEGTRPGPIRLCPPWLHSPYSFPTPLQGSWEESARQSGLLLTSQLCPTPLRGSQDRLLVRVVGLGWGNPGKWVGWQRSGRSGQTDKCPFAAPNPPERQTSPNLTRGGSPEQERGGALFLF